MKKFLIGSVFCLLFPALLFFSPRAEAANKVETALQAWIFRSDSALKAFSGLKGEQADRLFLQKESPFDQLEMSQELQNLDEALRPVLDRMPMRETTKKDKEQLSLLLRYGLNVEYCEGTFYLAVNRKFFQHRVEALFSDDMKAYLAVKDTQEARFFRDAALLYPLAKYGAWAVQWERFILRHPSNRYEQLARDEYHNLLDILMMCTLDNSPAFDYRSGRMSVMWQNELHALVEEYSGTSTAQILKDYLFSLRKNAYKLSKSDELRFKQRIAREPVRR